MEKDNGNGFIDGVEERFAGYVAKWLAVPELRAALHRYDDEVCGSAKASASKTPTGALAARSD